MHQEHPTATPSQSTTPLPATARERLPPQQHQIKTNVQQQPLLCLQKRKQKRVLRMSVYDRKTSPRNATTLKFSHTTHTGNGKNSRILLFLRNLFSTHSIQRALPSTPRTYWYQFARVPSRLSSLLSGLW